MKNPSEKGLVKEHKIYIFVLLIIIVLSSLAYYLYLHTENSIRKDKIQELEFFSRSKVDQLTQWYKERIADANVVSQSPFFSEAIRQWIGNRNNENLRNDILERLNPVLVEYQYEDIIIVSNEGEILLGIKEDDKLLPDYIPSEILQHLFTDSTTTSDFYYCEFHDEIHYDIISPLKVNDSTIVANIVFRINPNDFIYPLLSNLIYNTETGEVLLYRIEQDSILLLNEPRNNDRKPLQFKSTLSYFVDENTANDMLVKETIIETKDFKGHEVLAFSSRIENSPWLLITKIDKSEIFSELRFITIVIVFSTISLILILTLGISFYFSTRQENIYKELYRSELELRESQEEFRTTLYSIGDAVITTDKAGKVKEMNKVAEQLTGWTETEAKGKILREVFPIVNEDTGESIDNPVDLVINKGKTVGLANHTLLINRDGKQIPISDSGAPIRNSAGEIIGVVLVFHDQTKEREVKRAILESERKLATIMSNLPGMVFRCKNDEKWTVEFVSTGCIKLTEYKPEDFLGKNKISLLNIIHPYDVERVRNEINEALIFSSGFETEYRLTTKSGNDKYVLEKGQGIYSDEGELIALEGIITDITEKKNLQIAIEDSEELLTRTGSIAKIGGWEYDIAKNELTWTDEVANIYDLDPDTDPTVEVGLNLYTDESRVIIEKAFGDLVQDGIPFDLELDINSAKGVHKWVRAIGQPVKINDVLVKVRGSFQDITDKKLAQQKAEDNERLLKEMGSIAKIGGWEFDVATGEGKWTDEVAIIHDLNPEDPTSKDIGLSFYTNDSRVVIEKAIEDAVAFGKSYDLELEIISAKGVHKWVRTAGHPVIKNGKVVRLSGSFQDITEMKLRDAEKERLISILEATSDFVGIADKDGKPIYINKAGRTMIGLNQNEDIKHSSLVEFHPEWVHEILLNEAIPYSIEHGIWSGETAIIGKDGDEIPLSQLVISHKDKSGNVIYMSTIARDISKRKEYERKLESSDRIFNHSLDMLYIAGFDGYFKVLNPAWEKVLGFKREELMSKQWLDFVHPEDRDYSIEIGEKIAKGEHEPNILNRFITKDGNIKWLSWSVYVYTDDNLIYGSAKDVTEKVQLENEIKESNLKLKLALKNSPIVLFNQNRDLKYTWIYNPNIFDELDVIGKSDFDLLPEDEARKVTQLKQKVLETGIMIRETVTSTINGQRFYYDLTIEAQKDDKGNVTGINCASIDITERINFENDLLKLSQVVEQSSTSIIITDVKGVIEYVNPYFTKASGYSFEEVKGRNPNILKSGHQDKELYNQLWKTIKSGKDWRGELCNKKKNGELYWENVLISPVLDKNNEILYFVAIQEDITEKKKILNELVEAKMKAEESDRLKTAFLHNISHEIRTPLNGITGFTNLLNDPDLTEEEYEEFIEIINQSSGRLTSIISDLISIASIESGQEKLTETETEIYKLVSELHRQLKWKVDNSKIELTFTSNLSENSLKLKTDKTKLTQIISNLIENAIKFTAEGKIEIKIEYIKDKSKLLFTVEDTGIGIPKSFQEVIFDRFRQVETTDNRNFEGSGLGLSISKAYVELMGGEMWLESEEGKGSKFFFTIPYKPVN